MIDVVYKGWSPGGLVSYLFGPGRYAEHENPRVVATWDRRPERWQPEHVGPGEFDFDLSQLTAALQAPQKRAGLPVANPNPRRADDARFFKKNEAGQRVLRDGPVRHLTLRNAASDRTLSDREWSVVAEEMVHQAGWSRRDDVGGPRWAAVRHDDDGIHVVAVLVRQDNGKRVWPYQDYAALRSAARKMEHRLGVTITAQSDRTAAVAASRAEREKGARQSRVPAREELRGAVARAASASTDLAGFERELDQAGYLVQIKRFPSGDLRGYAVARPGDVDSVGEPIWYPGSKLASDLSLPRLLDRWGQARRGAVAAGDSGQQVPVQVWQERTVAAVERARRVLADNPDRVDGIAHAIGEVYVAVDRGPGRLVHGAGARWDRAARAPHQPVPETGRVADELRWLARGLSASGGSATVELAASLTALGLQIAALLQERGRAPQQARAGRQAARWMSSPPTPAATPRPSVPLAGRGPGRTATQRRAGRHAVSSTAPTSGSPPQRGGGRSSRADPGRGPRSRR